MTPEQILKSQGIFLQSAEINGFPVAIGYIKEFRWSWIGTQLNTFLFIADCTKDVDRLVIEKYSATCLQYALKNNKGWPRGFQSGVGSIAVLRGNRIKNDAIEHCQNVIKKHWSAFEVAVVYNQEEKRLVKYKKQPIWGRLYFPYFSNIIDKLEPALAQ
jgi:hypothetical protein